MINNDRLNSFKDDVNNIISSYTEPLVEELDRPSIIKIQRALSLIIAGLDDDLNDLLDQLFRARTAVLFKLSEFLYKKGIGIVSMVIKENPLGFKIYVTEIDTQTFNEFSDILLIESEDNYLDRVIGYFDIKLDIDAIVVELRE